jgi:hypothetical protein
MNEKPAKSGLFGFMKPLSGIFALGCAITAAIYISKAPDAAQPPKPISKEHCEAELRPLGKEHDVFKKLNLPFNGSTNYSPATGTCIYTYFANGEIRPYEWKPDLK